VSPSHVLGDTEFRPDAGLIADERLRLGAPVKGEEGAKSHTHAGGSRLLALLEQGGAYASICPLGIR